MNATITRSTDVKVGDQITELDTPQGPWYAVLKVNAKSLVVETASLGELADGESYPTTIRIAPNGAVLVRNA